jgi:hypothetical protein
MNNPGSVEAPFTRIFWRFDMKRTASIMVMAVLFLAFPLSPVHVAAGSDDFQNLEFFLERSLKNAKNSDERNEIINRFLFKALALVYQQNTEQIRLKREALNVLKELRDVKVREARELERYLTKR